jgi:hypothetical protein
MTTPDGIRAELVDLSQQYVSLAALAREPKRLSLFVAEYQRWYTRAVRLVTILGQDRLTEFEGYYLADPKRREIDDSTYCIQDYLLAVRPTYSANMDVHRAVVLRLTAQVSILQSLESRLEGIFAEIGGELLAEIEDRELEAARRILKVSPRAAGVLTAVVLETHLLRVARHHGLKIPPTRPTVGKLNDLLKKSGLCDEGTWRSTRLLFDQQRVILDDKKTEPEAAAVESLISQLQKIVKAVV